MNRDIHIFYGTGTFVSGAPKSLTVVNRKMKFIRLLLSGALSASMLSVIALSPVLYGR